MLGFAHNQIHTKRLWNGCSSAPGVPFQSSPFCDHYLIKPWWTRRSGSLGPLPGCLGSLGPLPGCSGSLGPLPVCLGSLGPLPCCLGSLGPLPGCFVVSLALPKLPCLLRSRCCCDKNRHRGGGNKSSRQLSVLRAGACPIQLADPIQATLPDRIKASW